MIKPGRMGLYPSPLVISVLITLLFLSFKLLINGNMGGINEEDVLPLAKQYADPTWIAGDWYLNQAPGYRLLFEALAGRLIQVTGFVTTSIVGRLICYGLIATSLVLIGQKLALRLPVLLLAIGLFLYVHPTQGLAAFEWMIGGLEAKSVAYSFVLLALWCMLEQRYRWMAALFGVATSFHVLVGGWAFLAAIGWLLCKHRLSFRRFGLMLLIYTAASSFALPAVWHQLAAQTPVHSPAPTFIYVFLRLPHHLNPLSWSVKWWISPLICLVILAISLILLLRRKTEALQPFEMSIELCGFTLFSLIPFIAGVAIAPFDTQGNLLQFYPFRVGDVMLPLTACLVSACALQHSFSGSQQKMFTYVCIVIVAIMCSTQVVPFQQQIHRLQKIPNLNAEFKALCAWTQSQTPKQSLIVTPPVEFVQFSWLAERPTVAKYKLLPQSKAGILQWYARMSDLNGGSFPTFDNLRTKDRRLAIQRSLTHGYYHLKTVQAVELMNKYQASYFMTRIQQHLKLPIAYQNSRYVLYRNL